MHKVTTRLGLTALAISFLLSSAVQAATIYRPETAITPFIWASRYLSAGTSYTIETRNLSAGGDSVLHVLYYANNRWTQVAANDDYSGLASRVTFVPSATGYYYIWVHSYAYGSSGTTDLVVNGSTILQANPFGGVTLFSSWNAGDEARVVATRRNLPNDFMLFLTRNSVTYLQHDDDSAVKFYPVAVAASTESGLSRFVWGTYPGTTGYARLLVQPPSTMGQSSPSNDVDFDGITNELERLAGTSPSNSDTDNDGISDYLELMGGYNNWYFSFSEGASPTRRTAWVEVDYMVSSNPADTRRPYAGLENDTQAIFNTDGRTDVITLIDGVLPWHRNVAFGCDPTWADCIDFHTLKATYFSVGLPERRPYFHYAVWGYGHSGGCSSGLAELLGNDFIISLGCWQQPTQEGQRGTYIHEFGHNLALTHYGSGNNNGNNSVVYRSVMNYRYQLTGLPPTARTTYSSGTSGCAPCLTSPKQACVDLRALGQCGTAAGASCDCDYNDWNATQYDFYEGSDWLDGQAERALAGTQPAMFELATAGAEFGVSGGAKPDEDDRLLNERLPKKVHGEPPHLTANKILDPTENLSEREARVPHEATQRKAKRAAALVKRLEKGGMQKAKDFTVSADGLHVYSVCP